MGIQTKQTEILERGENKMKSRGPCKNCGREVVRVVDRYYHLDTSRWSCPTNTHGELE